MRGKVIRLPEARLGVGTAASLALIREQVPFIEQDQLYGPHLDALVEMVRQGSLTAITGG